MAGSVMAMKTQSLPADYAEPRPAALQALPFRTVQLSRGEVCLEYEADVDTPVGMRRQVRLLHPHEHMYLAVLALMKRARELEAERGSCLKARDEALEARLLADGKVAELEKKLSGLQRHLDRRSGGNGK